jgi:tetratricopeptide (TPR) repeat protein
MNGGPPLHGGRGPGIGWLLCHAKPTVPMRFASVFILSGFLVLLSGMGEARDQGVPRPQEPRLAQQQDTNEVLALLAKADRPMPGGNGSRVNGRTVREEFIGPALALSRKLHWPRGEALALFLGSIALEQDGADGAARARLDSAVRMSGVLPLHERGLWLQHAALFEAVGEMDLDRADSLAVASLDCLSGGEWPQDHAASLEAQARVALFKRDWMNAILKYYRTIDRAEACQAGPTLAIAYEKMGMIMHELGDMNKAILYFRRSTHLSDSLGLTFRAYMGYFNWGSALLEVGRPDEALPLLRKAKAMASSPAMPRWQGRAGVALRSGGAPADGPGGRGGGGAATPRPRTGSAQDAAGAWGGGVGPAAVCRSSGLLPASLAEGPGLVWGAAARHASMRVPDECRPGPRKHGSGAGMEHPGPTMEGYHQLRPGGERRSALHGRTGVWAPDAGGQPGTRLGDGLAHGRGGPSTQAAQRRLRRGDGAGRLGLAADAQRGSRTAAQHPSGGGGRRS